MSDLILPAEAAPRRSLARFIEESAAFAEPFMVTAGLLAVIGQPLFYVIWRYLIPQPYENLFLRLMSATLCVPLVFKGYWPPALRRILPWYWHAAVLYTVPFLFALFVFLNHFSLMWVLTEIAGIFLLTFFVHWALAAAMFVIGSGAAYGVSLLIMGAQPITAPVAEILIVYVFTLCVGGAINYRLQRFREAQVAFEKRLRLLSGQNATMMREHNQLLGRFLNNVIVNRLQRFQEQHGLDVALRMITQQEKRFCGIMQADIRNFTRMFDVDTELQVAQLISQCFSEITATGQDLAVIKPIGDCIFLYSDEEHGREEAVLNILTLACLFVHSVDRINETLTSRNILPLNFGIAVHAGDAIYGNLASDTMIDPTVIGINVNRTARMEELTKSPVIRGLVGSNAVILSEEFYWIVRKAYRELPGVVSLDLAALQVSIRDFPHIKRVYALPQSGALAFYPVARERLRHVRTSQAPRFQGNTHSLLRGVEYYTQMYGSGPNTTWSIFFNVSAHAPERVSQIVRRHFSHLESSLSQGSERWLTLSTAADPGEYDETDVDGWIATFIDALTDFSDTGQGRSGGP